MSARSSTNPYARLNREVGLDYAVGDRIFSIATAHGGREGEVVLPLRAEPGRYGVLLEGDAAPVGVDPRMMARVTPSLCIRAAALGLAVAGHHPDLPALVVRGEDGRLRREAVPSDLVARDGRGLVVWRGADRHWPSDGWDVSRAGGPSPNGWMHGGRHAALGAALDWYQRAIDVEAGRATDFGGC